MEDVSIDQYRLCQGRVAQLVERSLRIGVLARSPGFEYLLVQDFCFSFFWYLFLQFSRSDSAGDFNALFLLYYIRLLSYTNRVGGGAFQSV